MTDLGDYLKVRRSALTPEHVGMPTYGTRRVPGLRREELAFLAGISPAYYVRLEQGIADNASPQVLDALARALELDEDETDHLHRLARSSAYDRGPTRDPGQAPRPTLCALLDAMPTAPAVIVDHRNDVLAWNRIGHRVLASQLPFDPTGTERRPNLMRMLFLDPHTRELYRDWDRETARAVASLRFIAAQYPRDRATNELVGELSTGSDTFASLWARHPVERCTSGTKLLHHPEVGDLELDFEVLHLADNAGQRLLTHTARDGSCSSEALRLLAGPA